MSLIPDNLAERILEASPDAILVSDVSGTVRYWNAGENTSSVFLPTRRLEGPWTSSSRSVFKPDTGQVGKK